VPDGGTVRPLALPGIYLVRVTLPGGSRAETQLEVRQDPESSAGIEDMTAQLRLHLELREMSDSTASLIARIEGARRRILDLTSMDEPPPRMLPPARTLYDRLTTLEMQLFDLRLTGGFARQDTIRWPRQLYAKIASLFGYTSGTDDAPTTQALEVASIYRERLASVRSEWAVLAEGALSDFNELLAELGLTPITQ